MHRATSRQLFQFTMLAAIAATLFVALTLVSFPFPLLPEASRGRLPEANPLAYLQRPDVIAAIIITGVLSLVSLIGFLRARAARRSGRDWLQRATMPTLATVDYRAPVGAYQGEDPETRGRLLRFAGTQDSIARFVRRMTILSIVAVLVGAVAAFLYFFALTDRTGSAVRVKVTGADNLAPFLVFVAIIGTVIVSAILGRVLARQLKDEEGDELDLLERVSALSGNQLNPIAGSDTQRRARRKQQIRGLARLRGRLTLRRLIWLSTLFSITFGMALTGILAARLLAGA